MLVSPLHLIQRDCFSVSRRSQLHWGGSPWRTLLRGSLTVVRTCPPQGDRRNCEPGWWCGGRARLLLSLLMSATLCHAQMLPAGSAPDGNPTAQSSSPAQFLPQSSSSQSSRLQTREPAGNAALPGIAAFAGSKVTGIRFDGVKASMLGPLPSQLELQPGEVLTDSKVRESLRRLYETGLYETIQVQRLRYD